MALFTAPPIRLSAPLPRRSFWERRVAGPVAAQFTQGISPEKIALSFAVGSLCAFFPVFGAATPLCIVAGAVLRLNQPVMQLLNWLTSPLYLPIVFAFVRLGEWLLDSTRSDLNPGLMAMMLRQDPGHFFLRFGAIAGHALVGWAVLAPAWIAAGYYLSRPILRAAAANSWAADARNGHGS